MKKLAIITAIFLSVASIGTAQMVSTDNREKLQFGLKAGLNYSNVYDEKGEEFTADPKFGLVGGVFLAIPIGKYIGIQPELLLSQKGYEGSGRVLGSSYYYKRTTTHIDVPLQFALKVSESLTLLGGPQFSYLINQQDVFSNSNLSLEQKQEFQNSNIRKNVFGAVGGLDINIQHFTIGARAGWDIQNNNGDGSSTIPRYKNVWYQGTIGFKFYD